MALLLRWSWYGNTIYWLYMRGSGIWHTYIETNLHPTRSHGMWVGRGVYTQLRKKVQYTICYILSFGVECICHIHIFDTMVYHNHINDSYSMKYVYGMTSHSNSGFWLAKTANHRIKTHKHFVSDIFLFVHVIGTHPSLWAFLKSQGDGKKILRWHFYILSWAFKMLGRSEVITEQICRSLQTFTMIPKPIWVELKYALTVPLMFWEL